MIVPACSRLQGSSNTTTIRTTITETNLDMDMMERAKNEAAAMLPKESTFSVWPLDKIYEKADLVYSSVVEKYDDIQFRGNYQQLSTFTARALHYYKYINTDVVQHPDYGNPEYERQTMHHLRQAIKARIFLENIKEAQEKKEQQHQPQTTTRDGKRETQQTKERRAAADSFSSSSSCVGAAPTAPTTATLPPEKQQLPKPQQTLKVEKVSLCLLKTRCEDKFKSLEQKKIIRVMSFPRSTQQVSSCANSAASAMIVAKCLKFWNSPSQSDGLDDATVESIIIETMQCNSSARNGTPGSDAVVGHFSGNIMDEQGQGTFLKFVLCRKEAAATYSCNKHCISIIKVFEQQIGEVGEVVYHLVEAQSPKWRWWRCAGHEALKVFLQYYALSKHSNHYLTWLAVDNEKGAEESPLYFRGTWWG